MILDFSLLVYQNLTKGWGRTRKKSDEQVVLSTVYIQQNVAYLKNVIMLQYHLTTRFICKTHPYTRMKESKSGAQES
jgi:hypothetical protein